MLHQGEESFIKWNTCMTKGDRNMNFYGQFPATRLRRRRTHSWLREMVQETRLHPSDLILPIFIRTPEGPAEIPSMPGVRRWTIAELPIIIEQVLEVGIPAVDLFPLTP